MDYMEDMSAGDLKGIKATSEQQEIEDAINAESEKKEPRRVYEWVDKEFDKSTSNGGIDVNGVSEKELGLKAKTIIEEELESKPALDVTEVGDVTDYEGEYIDMGKTESVVDLSNGKTAIDLVVDGIKYNFLRDALVKPLDAVKIKKTVINQKPNGKTDKKGFKKYDTVEEEVEVESTFRRGILLKLPTGDFTEFKPGDTVIYYAPSAKEFDLFKDSVLVKPYDFIAVERAA